MVPVRKPRGYWGIILALGLALACWSGQAQEQKPETTSRAEQTHESAPNPPSVGLPVQLIESPAEAEARERAEQEAERREIEDLVAQRGMNLAAQAMNDATQRMANYSLVSTVVVAVGTALLFWTLWETRKANRAAQEAVNVTKDIGKAQLKAYVCVDGGEVEEPGDGSIVLVARIKNFGATPAYDILHGAMSIFGPYPWADGPSVDLDETSAGQVLGPGADFAAAVRIFDQPDRRLAQAWLDVRSGSHGFWIQGIVRYRDTFGDHHITRYRLVLGGRLAAISTALHAHGDHNSAD